MDAVELAPRSQQAELFAADQVLPNGLVYRAGFLDAGEEAALLAAIAALPLHEARYKGYRARRRVASYGSSYDFEANELQRGGPLPAAFEALRARLADWIGVAPEAFGNALIAEYRPGTPLGWHRDVPDFERVVGVSLASACRMRFRPYPPRAPRRAEVLTLELAPRSAYLLQGEARWRWQHSIAPTPALRYSITMRTPAARARR
jgi:alkylated DNA repair dioxygenase AlkB